MLIWLDSTVNRKAQPNENYAREVMELFTPRPRPLHREGHPGGRPGLHRLVRRPRRVPRGRRASTTTARRRSWAGPARFGGDDIPAILLDQPACAEFLCAQAVPPVRQRGRPALRRRCSRRWPRRSASRATTSRCPSAMILRSNLFFDPSMRRRRVKSPVEFAVGTIRALEILKPTVSADALAEACGRMGQSLYAPPSVAGWDGGPAWINSTTHARPDQPRPGPALRRRRRPRPAAATRRRWPRGTVPRPPEQRRRFLHRPAASRTRFDPSVRRAGRRQGR